MTDPAPLDYETPERRATTPWWIVLCAVFVFLQNALIALGGLAIARDEQSPTNLVGLCIFVFAIAVAWNEWTLLRDRDPDSSLIVNLVCGLITAVAAIVLVRIISEASLTLDDALIALAPAAVICAEIATMVAQHRFTHAIGRASVPEEPSP